jgi:hypothetical protein
MSGNSGATKPNASLEIFDPAFTSFVRRIVAVPHSEIKAKLDAEKRAKQMSKASVSRASGAKPKLAR